MTNLSFGVLGRGWAWFIDGLTEAWLWVAERWDRRPAIHAHPCDEGFILKTGQGETLGRLIGSAEGQQLELARPVKTFVGAEVEVHIPAPWLFRRKLDPVAAESAPYLDGFVRHQIDRITPWRSADVHYAISHAPLAGDPGRLLVEVGVVPRRLVHATLEALKELSPKQIRLVAETAGAPPFRLELDQSRDTDKPRIARLVTIGVTSMIVALSSVYLWAWWETGVLQSDIEAQDQVIEQRRSVLAAAQRRDRSGSDAEQALQKLRDGRPRIVNVMEALSAALPDTAYLNDLEIEGDKITLSGISRDLSQLVPALETSGYFRNVAFSAATTRVEAGDGDVFHLEMQLAKPKQEVASP